MLRELPGESAYKTAVRDSLPDEQLAELAKHGEPGHGPWSRTDLRLAAIEDLLAVLARGMRIQGDWKPVPRPGIAAARRRRIGAAQLAYLQRLRDRHEEQYGDTSGRNIIQFPGSGGAETG